MTVIINTIWGGLVSQVVDRQISIANKTIVDPQSNKVCIILTSDALATIAYTGIAVANESWLDCVISNSLAHKQLSFSVAQPGAPCLARPIHTIINELSLNLNGVLNSDKRARAHDLKISIIGWHFGKTKIPFAWELTRGPADENKNRFFKIRHHKVGKFLRENPKGLWGETLGDPGKTIDEDLISINKINGLNHDGVEKYIRNSIVKRSKETITVSSDCIAIQLNPFDPDGQVQFTYYPGTNNDQEYPLLSPWVLTPRLICAPSETNSSCSSVSECKNYVVGGFIDVNTNLNIRTRLPINFKQNFRGLIKTSFQERKITI